MVIGEIGGFIGRNKTALAIGTGAAVVGAVGGLAIGKAIGGGSPSKKRKYKKKTTKRKLTARQKYVRKIKKRKGRQSPYTAGARKDRSTRRIRHTKNGQPYILLKSGKAKFIKKSSARASRRRKGGRY